MFHTHTPAGADCSWGHPLRRCCGNRTSSVIVAALRGTTYGRGKRISDFLDPWGATSLGMPGPLFDQKMIYPFSFAGPLDKDCFLDAGTCCLTWRIFFYISLSLSLSLSVQIFLRIAGLVDFPPWQMERMDMFKTQVLPLGSNNLQKIVLGRDTFLFKVSGDSCFDQIISCMIPMRLSMFEPSIRKTSCNNPNICVSRNLFGKRKMDIQF